MSNLSAEDRKKLPESDFAGPNRTYPIVDASDVADAAALIGKADDPEAVKRRIIAIAKRKGFSIPDAWKEKADMADTLSIPATFTAASEVQGETVVRRGLIFRPGDYPEIGFSVSPEELQAAVADFHAAPLNLQHVPTVLDGKLGTLRKVEVRDDALYGEAEIPRWLHEVLGDEAVPVSTEWDRATKRLERLSLARGPRVKDAALLAAFARHDTPQGQSAMQHLHDVAAQHGATCKKPTADMASKHEASAIQQAHDLAVAHGARCAGIGAGVGPAFYSDDGNAREGGKETLMSKAQEHFQAFLTALGFKPSEGEEVVKLSQDDPPARQQDDPRLAALAEQLAAERAARWQAEAAQFAEAEIVTHKRAMPFERGALIASYLQAARDDQEHPAKVTFALDGKAAEGTRLDALRALQAGRPAHHLTAELLDPSQDAAVQAAAFAKLTAKFAEQHDASISGKEKPPTPERIAELKRLTPLGEAVLNGEEN